MPRLGSRVRVSFSAPDLASLRWGYFRIYQLVMLLWRDCTAVPVCSWHQRKILTLQQNLYICTLLILKIYIPVFRHISDFLISTLDLSKNYNLSYLACYHNSLSSIDFKNNLNLTHILCSNNHISKINVGNLLH